MKARTRTTPTQKWLIYIVHLGSLLPLAVLTWAALQGQLGFNPVETALRRSGRVAVALLLLSLAVTPLRKILNLPLLARLRKPLGLYAALYALVHFGIFAVWDFGLNLGFIVQEFRQKPFLLLGLGALLILAALAVTSNRCWQKKLGQAWRWLQRGVYLAAVLASLHYFLAVKGDLLTLQGNYTWPIIAAAALLLLLVLRIPSINNTINHWLGHE